MYQGAWAEWCSKMHRTADVAWPESGHALPMRLRGLLAPLLLALVATLALPMFAVSAPGRMAPAQISLDSGVLDQLNAIRLGHGLVPLTANPLLAAAAVQHAQEMAADGYFAH